MSSRFVKWRIGIFGIMGILALVLLWKVRAVISPFLIAFGIAYVLSPAIQVMEKRGFSRKGSVAIVFLIIFGAGCMLVFYGIPEGYRELSRLADSLPSYSMQVQSSLDSIQAQYQKFGLPPGIMRAIDATITQGEFWLEDKVQKLIASVVSLVTSLPLLILAPVLAIYILLDWERIKQGIKGLVPGKWRGGVIHLSQEINFSVRKFLRGNLVVSVIVALLTGLGMQIVGMDYALLIGISFGILELIPYFGPILASIPALALALMVSESKALWVLGVIIVIQQLESAVIQPKIMGDSLGLHPVAIVFVVLAGAKLFGFWGMVFAVPLVGAVRVVVRYTYLKLV